MLKKLFLLTISVGLFFLASCSASKSSSPTIITTTTTPTTLPNLAPSVLASRFLVTQATLPIGFKEIQPSFVYNPVSTASNKTCGSSQPAPIFSTYSGLYVAPGNSGILSQAIYVFQTSSQAKSFIANWLSSGYVSCLTSSSVGSQTPVGLVLSSQPLSMLKTENNIGSIALSFSTQNNVIYSPFGVVLANPNNVPGFNQKTGGIDESIQGFAEDKVASIIVLFYSQSGDGQTLDLTLLAQQLATAALS